MTRRLLIIAAVISATIGCNGGGGGSNDAPAAPTAPNSPTIEASASAKKYMVTWAEVEGATSYNVYSSSEPDQDPKNYAAYDNPHMTANAKSPLEHTVSKLNEEYFVVATSFNGPSESPASNRARVFPRYEISGPNNEYIRDYATNLEWQRCSRGQSWNGTTKFCDGEATRDRMANNGAAAPNGWKVPTLAEAQSLVYCDSRTPAAFPPYTDSASNQKCQDSYSSPTVVNHVFPNTGTDSNYQTSTLYYSGSTLVARTISYIDGSYCCGVPYNHPDVRIAVRYVRSFTP